MAVADELRASGAEVTFLGTRERIEADLVPAAGYEIDFVKVRGIDRGNRLRAAVAGAEAVGAAGTALRVLWRRRPDVVMGGGGFVAGPAGLAAVLARVPLVLTEADSHLGLANRLLARRRKESASPSRSPGARGSATSSPGARCRRRCSRRTAAPPGSASGSPPTPVACW